LDRKLGQPEERLESRSREVGGGDGDVTVRFSYQLSVRLSVARILAVPLYIHEYNGTESKAF
jgi:hypothetical protein